LPPDERVHAYLWLRLSICGDSRTQRDGSELNGLRQDRTKADYDLHRLVPQRIALAAVRIGEWIILALDAAALAPTRTQITDAMKVYERDVLQIVTWHP